MFQLSLSLFSQSFLPFGITDILFPSIPFFLSYNYFIYIPFQCSGTALAFQAARRFRPRKRLDCGGSMAWLRSRRRRGGGYLPRSILSYSFQPLRPFILSILFLFSYLFSVSFPFPRFLSGVRNIIWGNFLHCRRTWMSSTIFLTQNQHPVQL